MLYTFAMSQKNTFTRLIVNLFVFCWWTKIGKRKLYRLEKRTIFPFHRFRFPICTVFPFVCRTKKSGPSMATSRPGRAVPKDANVYNAGKATSRSQFIPNRKDFTFRSWDLRIPFRVMHRHIFPHPTNNFNYQTIYIYYINLYKVYINNPWMSRRWLTFAAHCV